MIQFLKKLEDLAQWMVAISIVGLTFLALLRLSLWMFGFDL